jgi:hypothetical protein
MHACAKSRKKMNTKANSFIFCLCHKRISLVSAESQEQTMHAPLCTEYVVHVVHVARTFMKLASLSFGSGGGRSPRDILSRCSLRRSSRADRRIRFRSNLII